MDEARLREDIAKHLLWLETRGRDGVRADLGQAHLGRTELSGENLSFANLSEADLRGANLCLTNLSRADLSGADLCSANLGRADLSRASLHLTNLSRADLSEATLYLANLHLAHLGEANLRGANLSHTNLSRADLRGANLSRADLSEADLHLANLSEANLRGANLRQAHLSEANLSGAELSGADLSGAGLRGANLQRARLVEVNLSGADLNGAEVYGISAWNVVSDRATTCRDLVITPGREPAVTADDLDVAQVVHLLLCNVKLRRIIEALVLRVVLIVGRFGVEHEAVLEALKEALRRRSPALVPVVFEVPAAAQLSFVETVSQLIHMARFVIADLTHARLALQELPRLARQMRTPIAPIVREGPGNLPLARADLDAGTTVLPVFSYRNLGHLRAALDEAVIEPAEQAARQLPPPYGAAWTGWDGTAPPQ
jgi:uncharacterized protein YjbI with pentapeptide repeats